MSEASYGPSPKISTGRGSEMVVGLRIALPAALAMVPLGLALGVLIVQAGLPWWAAPLFAGVVFAGSLEFLLVGMVTAMVPIASVAVTALLVNFRHVFYALSFPITQIRSLGLRGVSAYLLCDESWALMAGPEARRWSGTRILTIQVAIYLSWVASSTVGALAGGLIPDTIVGLDFAITALFLVLAIDAYKVRRSVPLVLVALVAGIGFAVLAPDAMLLAAMGSFVAVLLVGYFLQRRGGRG
mgnify:CR=1 FL=1